MKGKPYFKLSGKKSDFQNSYSVRRAFIQMIATLVIFSAIFASVLIPGSDMYASSQRYNLTYLYGENTSKYIQYVSITNGALDAVCPDYFELDSNGNLKLTYKVDKNFVDNMHQKGILVTPFLTNNWDRELGRKGLKNREKLVKQIKDAIIKYDFNGINVDIENTNHQDRESYTDFIRLLREAMPDRVIGVAVAPNPYGWTTGWQGSYDYAEIGKHSDYIMLMAYDEHYEGGPPGPVASAEFVKLSIEYALKYVPKEKLILGIPFYGRIWKDGESYGGRGINNTTVETLISNYNGRVEYDEKTQTAVAVIVIGEYDLKPKLSNGTVLGAGTYRIWYDNEQSIAYKLGLVNYYDLKGVGSWRVGQEQKGIWDNFIKWLNANWLSDKAPSGEVSASLPLVDISGHWSEKAIMELQERGWVAGDNGYYYPERTLTRAEAVTMIVKAMGMDNLDEGKDFSDTVGHWAQKAIRIAREYNIVAGIDDDKFGPDLPVKREEIAEILSKVLRLPAVEIRNSKKYEDVPQSRWSYSGINKLTFFRIIEGYPDNLFKPDNYLLRGEMAALLKKSSPYIASMK